MPKYAVPNPPRPLDIGLLNDGSFRPPRPLKPLESLNDDALRPPKPKPSDDANL